MNVVGYDPFVDAERAKAISADMASVPDLSDLYPACDYITIHVPALKDTVGMIDEAAIAQMKDGAVFLNFWRDTLVNDAAMAAALEAGKVARYVNRFRQSGRGNAACHRDAPLGRFDQRGGGQLRQDGRAVGAIDYLERGVTLHQQGSTGSSGRPADGTARRCQSRRNLASSSAGSRLRFGGLEFFFLAHLVLSEALIPKGFPCSSVL